MFQATLTYDLEQATGQALKVPLFIEQFKWENNFSAMRNNNFAMVPKDEYDFYLWMDSDDTLVGGENIQAALGNLAENESGLFLRYDYQMHEELDIALIQQWRERLLSTKDKWVWFWPVHEVCHSRPGTVFGKSEKVWICHWRKPEYDKETRIRNRAILQQASKDSPDEPRIMYYMANELYAEGAYVGEDSPDRDEYLIQAIKLYERFIKATTWNDDAYIANHNMAECWRIYGDHNKAIDIDLQGIKIYPTWPACYIGLAQSFLYFGEWEKMLFWCNTCINNAKTPETSQVHEPLSLTWTPLLLRGIAHESMNEIDKALSDYEKAHEIDPSNKVIIDHINELKEKLRTGIVIPSVTRRQAYFGSKKRKSICFVTRPLFEPWHPLLMATDGAGGAETCVMKIAPYFAADGWDVTVFGTPGEHAGTYEGVEYASSEEWSPKEFFNVTISSRASEIFDAEINSEKKLLWMHDVNLGPDAFTGSWGNRLKNIDKIIGLTNWHIGHMSALYGIPIDKFSICPYGIDLDRFANTNDGDARSRNKLVYSSSPDRGIDVIRVRETIEINTVRANRELINRYPV